MRLWAVYSERFQEGRTCVCYSEIQEKVRSLAGRYDAWLLVLEPLKHVDLPRPPAILKQVEQLLQVVEEVRAGARFGGATQLNVDADMASSVDAAAAAAIVRWLPDWLAWQQHSGMEAALIAAIEGFSVHSSGRAASLSFALPDDKVNEIVEARRKQTDADMPR